MSPYDDGWLFDLLAVEIRLNDPRSISVREALERPSHPRVEAHPGESPSARTTEQQPS